MGQHKRQAAAQPAEDLKSERHPKQKYSVNS